MKGCHSVRSRKALQLAAFGLFALPALAQRGALTLQRNLGELTQQAQTIVHGRVMSARVEPHPQLTNLSTVVVTLRVQETLKGQASSMLSFRQFVWDIRDQMDTAGYHKGQELLLLLNPVSQYGLTSPAGLEQGRFLITRDVRGQISAVNGRGNAGLFQNVVVQAQQKRLQLSARTSSLAAQHRQGPAPLDQVEEVIRQFAGK